MQFQSDRLSFRLINDGDFDDIYRLQSDPVAMHFIRAVVTEAAPVLERMLMWAAYAADNPGFGVLAVESIDRPQFIGYSVFRHLHFEPGNEVEIGYTISKEHTGRGLATEAALRLMKYGQDEMGIRSYVAYTNQLNLASNRVLEKCGFAKVGEEVVNDLDCFRWEVSI